MRDCFFQYRKGLYEALSALKYHGQNIPVMEYAPDNNSEPYIQILNMNSSPEDDAYKFSQSVETGIMVVTAHDGPPDDFGSQQSDEIMEEVMSILITQGVTVADRSKHVIMINFVDNGCFFVSLSYSPDFDGAKTTIRKVLTIRTVIDEK